MNVDILWKPRRHQTFSSTTEGPRFTLKPGMNKVDAEVLATVLAAGQDRPTGIAGYINDQSLVVVGPDGEEAKPLKGYGDPNVPLGLKVPPKGAFDEDEDLDDESPEDLGDDDHGEGNEDGEPAGGAENTPSAGDASPDDEDEKPEAFDDYTVEAAAEVIGATYDVPTLEKWAEHEKTVGADRVGVAKAIADQLELIETAGG